MSSCDAMSGPEGLPGHERPPEWFCGALRHQGGGSCRHRAGHGTDHVGVGCCKLHGGSTPNQRAAAREGMAMLALARIGRPISDGVDPSGELLGAVREASAMVVGLRDLVDHLVDPHVAGDAHALYGPDHLGDGREHVLMRMLGDWSDRRVRYAAEAIKAGLADRLVRIEEERTTMVARVMMAFVDDPELGLSRDQRELARRLVGRHLRALGAAA